MRDRINNKMPEDCYSTNRCPFYLEYLARGGEPRVDVISFSGSAKIGGISHSCLALAGLGLEALDLEELTKDFCPLFILLKQYKEQNA